MKSSTMRRTSFLLVMSMIVTLMTPSAFAAGDSAASLFDDVGHETPFREDIEVLAGEGILNGTSDSAFSPDSDISAEDFLQALYHLDGAPVITCVESPEPVLDAFENDEMASWAYAYGMVPSAPAFSGDSDVTCQLAAEMLYHYAAHHDAVLPEFSQALDWTVDQGMMDADSSRGDALTRAEAANVLHNYMEADLAVNGVTEEGLTLIYPSESQRTICPLRDFYVIGDIDDDIFVPADAALTVTVTAKDGTLMREVSTNIKDNQNGMYVDYPGIDIVGDREAFKTSMMPDLVYNPANPETFKDTWNKAYYTDDHYTCVVYGGSYHQDINPIDQFGHELKPLPEGDYELKVTLTCAGLTLGYLDTQITIGVVANKVLSRFSPDIHMEKVEAYAKKHRYVVFLDPFPGYWNTTLFLPDWGTDFTAEIVRRWSLADREEYIGGMTHFFDYNITSSSTSYSVELGQLAYDKALDQMNSLSYCYYDIGEPEITQHGTTIQGKFIQKDNVQMNPLEFTRTDHSMTESRENFISPAILEETTSQFDSSKSFDVHPGETISLNGVCKVIQPEEVTFLPDTESFQMGNRIASVTYTIKLADGTFVKSIDKEISGLDREFADGKISKSILEFRHNFTVDETMRGNTYRIFAQAKDMFGNDVGGMLYGCMFRVPR